MDSLQLEAFLREIDDPPVAFDEKKGLWLRVVSGAQREAWEDRIDAAKADKRQSLLYAALVVLAVCDKDGKRHFTDDQEEALEKMLGHKMLKRLFDAAFALNRMGEAGVSEEKKDSRGEAAGAEGRAAPAIPTAETGASGSSSPAPSP